MRVEEHKVNTHVYCEDCDPPHKGVGSPFSMLNHVDADPDAYNSLPNLDALDEVME
jgi:hypothetical protein